MGKRKPLSVRREVVRLRVQENLSTPAIAKRLGLYNQLVYKILEGHPPWTGERIVTGARATWAATEIEILRRLWPVADKDEICAALPNRAFGAIGHKASSLKIKRRLPGARKNTRFRFPIINQLREARESRGLTRVALADKSGYHVMQLHQWEMGKAVPNLKRLLDWAEALGFEVVLQKSGAAANGGRIVASKEALMGSGSRTPIVRL